MVDQIVESVDGSAKLEGGQGTDWLDLAVDIEDPTQLEINGFELP